jgi:opacity protein-like surface antigen
LADTFDTSFVFKPVNPEASNLDNYDRHFRVIKRHRLSTSVNYNINEKNSVGANFDFQTTSADANDNVASDDRSNEQQIQTGISYAYRLTKYIALQLGYAFGRSFTAKDNPSRSQYTFHNIIAGVNVAF